MRVSLKKAIAESLIVQMRKDVHFASGYDPAPDVVVLAASSKCVLVRWVDTFLPDGYKVIARDMIKSLDTSTHRDFRKSVIVSEGNWPDVMRAPEIDLKNMTSVLMSLKKLDVFAVILREEHDEWRSLHCKIIEISEENVTLHGFDGAGRWERRSVQVPIADITYISFGSNYLQMYEKYAPKIAMPAPYNQ